MANVKRKVRDHRDAVQLLRAFEVSGQALAPFCLAHGIDGRSLRCWRTNLARRSAPPDSSKPRALRLLEVTSMPRVASLYRIRVGDITVELDDNFRADTLGRILDQVRTC